MKRILFILVIWGGLSLPSRAEESTPAPYLYYYSETLGGFVVERADGSDSRLFSPGYTQGNPSASNPGWSPSGEWFAWHEGQGYVEKIDGQSHFDVLKAYPPQLNNVVDMDWSPSQRNLLLIIGSHSVQNCICLDETTFIVRDMDAQQDLVMFSLPINQRYYFANFTAPEWKMDTGSVSIGVLINGESSDFQAVQLTLGFNGKAMQEQVTSEAWEECCNFLEFLGVPSGMYDNPFNKAINSPSGRYQATAGYNTALLDHQTGKTVELPMHTGVTLQSKYLNFNTPETWILVGETDFVAGDCCGEPFLVGVTNVDASYWRELARCYNCAAWLPEQVNPALLPSGAPESVLPAPARTEYHDEIVQGWRNPNFELNCAPDDPLKRLLTPIGGADSDMTIELTFEEACNLRPEAPQSVLAAISPDQHLLALSAESHRGLVSLWNLETGQLIVRLNTFGYEMTFSPDSNQLITRTARATLTWDMREFTQ